MSVSSQFIHGEFIRTLDERFRLSIPQELLDSLAAANNNCMLVKERPGCLSLWPADVWIQRSQAAIELIHAKLRAGKLQDRLPEVQHLGRLLSTRHKPVQLAGRGRLLISEGFREFLQIAAGGECAIIGAAVCIEIWNPASWRAHLETELPSFQTLFEKLAN
jgi:transcriptional regulator MraZ